MYEEEGRERGEEGGGLGALSSNFGHTTPPDVET